ncbi:TonB C-terminal domain-containing protein [Candidatus Babeliales bacterium]|nr:TonB C-terminal domain-containing protein [Candidatus Babeliales bacterium]
MWRLLPNVLCSKTTGCLSQRKIFFLQLIVLVFFLHVSIFGLYALAVFLFSTKEKFDLSLSNKAVTYVLLPLQRNAGAKKTAALDVAKKSQLKSHVITMQTYLDKKSKQSAPKVSKATISAKLATTKSAKKVAQVVEEKASIKIQDTVKKNKANSLERATAKQRVVKHEIVDVDIEQIAEHKKNESKDVASEVKQDNQNVISALEVESNQIDESLNENDVIFVGAVELQHHMVGSKIQQTIQQHWNVPIGMEQGTSCELQVKIGDAGQAVTLQVIKSSGVLVYDSCARKTLQKIEYPKQVWNKTITIVLGAT